MQHRLVSRSALLGLSLLAGTAAAPAPTPLPTPAAPAGDGGGYGHFLTGMLAMRETDLNTAADAFLLALKDDPANGDLLQRTFLACALSGRPDALRLAAALPGNLAAQLLLANEDARAGRWDQAESRFTGLGHGDGVVQVLQPLLVAWAQQGSGRTEAALATLRPFETGPQRGIYVLHAALIADLAGRGVEAGRLYAAARAAYPELNLRLAQVLANWQARNGHLPEAQATIHALVGDAPDLAIAGAGLQAGVGVRAVARAGDGMAEAYLALAASLRQQDTPDIALLMLRFALDLRPDFAPARLVTAELQSADKQYDAALATLAAVPAGDPLAAVVRLRQAALTESTGDTAAASRDLEQLARDVPDSPAPLVQQADMLRAGDRFPEAVRAYDAALARMHGPGASSWPLFYARGVAYDRAHDWPHAEADLQHALQLSPDQPAVLNYLAYSWTEQGHNLAQARQMLGRALEARPNEGSIIDSLGWVMLRQGQVKDAVETLTRAVELETEDPVINAHLGDADQAAGHHLDAAYQWQLALTFHPTPEDAAALQAKLKALPPDVVPTADAR